MDARYPGIIARVEAAIGATAGRTPGLIHRPGCIELYSNWKHWLCMFPQHAPGHKHERPIRMEPWQQQLIRRHPGAFLAGLIQSDGCRCINRVKGYEYPRYFFTNRSGDIRGLFVSACAIVGVASRPAGRYNMSVARQASVQILDRLVGPKH
jgi:hypothetical protein